jgi:hypothetical protein
MVTDLACWAIFAAGIAFIGCGCILTRRVPQHFEAVVREQRLDRAA